MGELPFRLRGIILQSENYSSVRHVLVQMHMCAATGHESVTPLLTPEVEFATLGNRKSGIQGQGVSVCIRKPSTDSAWSYAHRCLHLYDSWMRKVSPWSSKIDKDCCVLQVRAHVKALTKHMTYHIYGVQEAGPIQHSTLRSCASKVYRSHCGPLLHQHIFLLHST